MKANPLLEELWRVKDDLGREAGYDIDRIFAELRVAELTLYLSATRKPKLFTGKACRSSNRKVLCRA